MRFLPVLAITVSTVSAFPKLGPAFDAAVAGSLAKRNIVKRDTAQSGCTTSTLCDTPIEITDEQANIPTTTNAAVELSQSRNNCGFLHAAGCTTFDAAEQSVSTSGDNAYQSPSATDIRGPCPGLNAAANHGYLPRSGVVNMNQTVTGLYDAYGMGADLAEFLAIYSIVFDGDLVSMTWSIGGPWTGSTLGLLAAPQGDGYSHNNYEGDTSITRCDAYVNGGDAHSVSLQRFQYAWDSGVNNNDNFTFDTMGRLFAQNTHRSIQTNPYYFAPLFSTTLVAPAAHNFIVAFMSNHSEEYPAGYLNSDNFQTFWGVSGTSGDFTWNKGQERIPDNFYRRPGNAADVYAIPDVFGDLLPNFLAYPDTFRLGGNTDGVNTYTGVDIANLTGGVYNADTLFEGNNFACFFFQNEQQAIPQQLQGLVNDLDSAVAAILDVISPLAEALSCPALSNYNGDAFTQYTGSSLYYDAPTTGPVNC